MRDQQEPSLTGSGFHPNQKPEPRRKKGLGRREWAVVGPAGEFRVVEAGKQYIMRRTGLPARDLRVLDPALSYPSTVLGRESAVVVNLEHIKVIVTANEVLVSNFKDPLVVTFVSELQEKIKTHHGRHELKEGEEKAELKEKDTPFEFVALEACLEAVCSCLENEATTLEKEAHPALDKLTSQISTLNLEHVRQIKSRLVAISGRVQKVRDELEHLLDDDDDMAEMYLTRKLMRQHLGSSSRSFNTEQADEMEDEKIGTTEMSICDNMYNDDEDERPYVMNVESRGTRSCSTRSIGGKRHYVDELEMILEAYFVQIDSTLNNLSALREYVDDTEDYINIMLDDKQNHLLQMGVVLTTATLIVSAFVVMAGIFGMNIKTDLFDEQKAGTPEFLWTIGGGATGSLLLYAAAIAWCKYKGLLD